MTPKETLEEAAKRLFSKYSNNTSLSEGHYDYLMDIEDFKDASTELVKWQAERMYSEEEVRKIAEEVKWQAIGDPLEFTKHFDEWFEENKKK